MGMINDDALYRYDNKNSGTIWQRWKRHQMGITDDAPFWGSKGGNTRFLGLTEAHLEEHKDSEEVAGASQ